MSQCHSCLCECSYTARYFEILLAGIPTGIIAILISLSWRYSTSSVGAIGAVSIYTHSCG